MSALSLSQECRPASGILSRWRRAWTRRFGRSDLSCCSDHDIERQAHELGISPSELRNLARRSARSADLVLRRLKALDLDPEEVSRVEPAVFQDLQRVCSLCRHHRRCARDFAKRPDDPVWQSYCPNLETLKALDALPWASRREW